MRFNTKIRYGMRAMVEIAKTDIRYGILQKDISRNQKISVKYLDQIIPQLKAAGLIVNVKGKKSGYRLTMPASDITVFDIYKAFKQEIAVNECLSEYFECELQEICQTYPFWQGLNELIINYFISWTLEDLVNKEVKEFNITK